MHTAVEHLLARIDERHGTTLRLEGRYAAGQNHGAYAVRGADGARRVLKWHDDPRRLLGLERARAITDRLRELGAPAPEYLLAGAFPDGATYWLQSALPGAPPDILSERQLRELLDLNDLQAGRVVSPEQDWSAYVAAVVFDGESGWAGSLREQGPATRAVLEGLERLVEGKRECCVDRGDIVHGDLALDNILVEEDRIADMVDWDAAGRGDRVLDLAKPLLYSYRRAPVRERLKARIVEIAGLDALHVYLAYSILAQLDGSIRRHCSDSVAEVVDLAHAILRDLEEHG